MQEQPFACEGVLGKVKRRNIALHSFETALYTRKLYKVYGDIPGDIAALMSVNVDTSPIQDGENLADRFNVQASTAFSRPDVQASLEMQSAIDKFCEVAPRLTDIAADDVKWMKAAKATPEQVDAMFQFWLEREDFREAVTETIQAVDFPNGKEGASAALLTTEDLTDPLLEAPALSTETT